MEDNRKMCTGFDIAEIIKALQAKDKICQRYTHCGECPLGKLGALDTDTDACMEMDKLVKRLGVADEVVETL